MNNNLYGHFGRRARATTLRASGMIQVVVVFCALTLGACTSPETATLDGSATYRERIALPPDALFEVTLEDVSLADASSTVLGSVTIDSAGQPPFDFQIPYDADEVEPGRRYAVRAMVKHEGQVLFTTEQAYPVFEGDDEPVEVVMVSAGRAQTAGAAGGGAGERLGMFSYMADAASITLCSDGERVPVAMEGDFAALESAYLSARIEPGQPILVSIQGEVVDRPSMEEGQPPRATLVVERFVSAWPGETCGTPSADSRLRGTYWKLVRLSNTPTEAVEGQREPHLIFDSFDTGVRGSGGCNSIAGTFDSTGDSLSVQLVGTLMACNEGAEQEQRFLEAMSNVERYAISGSHLEVFGASGTALARFEAVALD